uniref:NADH dehydrogenase subunit 6 n=1 Tax=Laemobothrion maximum TaxID=2337902 RepID=UPI00257D5438|nr:NADH dehydrogenase subunit 6 [Laemobothrion maximum]WGU50347.1 NADH dehydrogenase subunit 6 [Laemobothrion maximum]
MFIMTMDSMLIWTLCLLIMLGMSFFFSFKNHLSQLICVVVIILSMTTLYLFVSKISLLLTLLLLIVMTTGLMVIIALCISLTYNNPVLTNKIFFNPWIFFGGLIMMMMDYTPSFYFYIKMESSSNPLIMWIWSTFMFLFLLFMVVMMTWIARSKGGGMRYQMK